MTLLDQHKINHVAIVIDQSGSMEGKQKDVVAVVDGQVKWLADLSKSMNQETRVSIYTFNNDGYYGSPNRIECIAFDTDALRLPSLAGHYLPNGGTPLIDATLKSIEDLQKTAQMYGDHAFLVFVITDGKENTSRASGSTLAHTLGNLPDNWTVGCLVPDFLAQAAAQNYGFSKGNTAIWDVNSATGVAEFGQEIKQATESFYTGRDSGVRSTKTLFAGVTVNNVTQAQVDASKMKPVDPTNFVIVPVALASTSSLAYVIPKKSITRKNPNGVKNVEIMPFVQETGRTYVAGNAYYELTKSEKWSNEKDLALIHRVTKKVYRGQEAKDLIGIKPDTTRIRPQPDKGGEFDIFPQSTSTNRHLPLGSRVLLFK